MHMTFWVQKLPSQLGYVRARSAQLAGHLLGVKNHIYIPLKMLLRFPHPLSYLFCLYISRRDVSITLPSELISDLGCYGRVMRQMFELIILKILLQISISVSQLVPKPKLRKVEQQQNFQILSFKAPFSRKTSISHMAKPMEVPKSSKELNLKFYCDYSVKK